MNQQEEDALVKEHGLRSGGDPVEARIRLAIRAAVAAERERCAKVCENIGDGDQNWTLTVGDICAAAIRRGS